MMKMSKIYKMNQTETWILEKKSMLLELITKEVWAPAIYNNGIRSNAGFTEAMVIGLDIDEGLSIEEAQNILETSGYSYILGTTKSHQIEKNGVVADRFRIVLFLTEYIKKAAVYKANILKIAKELGLPVDKQATDAARMFRPCKELVAVKLDGKRIKPDHEIKFEDRKTSTLSEVEIENLRANKLPLYRSTLEALEEGFPPGGTQPVFFKCVLDLINSGYSLEEAEPILEAGFKHHNNNHYNQNYKYHLKWLYNKHEPDQEQVKKKREYQNKRLNNELKKYVNKIFNEE